jgi:hypothetical protein
MKFTIPQFIERDSKIVGPFSFKQFAFILVAGVICVVFYIVFPMIVFILLSIIVMGAGLFLAMFKIGRTTLPELIKNLFVFILRPKIYFWHKKTRRNLIGGERLEKIEKIEKPRKKISVPLKRKGALQDLSMQIETKK